MSDSEIREFLRSRRARISPEEAGLARQPGSRRVPGLRREEVAQLAGMSVDYYIRLERGRPLNVSDAVLDALARALRLNDLERSHLYALARPTHRVVPPQQVRPELGRVLDALVDTPALVQGPRMEVLAINPMGLALYADLDTLPVSDRNIARYMFLVESARKLCGDWEASARSVVAALHRYAGRNPRDPLMGELTGELAQRDGDFRRYWADHDVNRHTHGSKRYNHPIVGELTLSYEALTPTGDPDQTLGIHTAEPGSTSEDALRLLAVRTRPTP